MLGRGMLGRRAAAERAPGQLRFQPGGRAREAPRERSPREACPAASSAAPPSSASDGKDNQEFSPPPPGGGVSRLLRAERAAAAAEKEAARVARRARPGAWRIEGTACVEWDWCAPRPRPRCTPRAIQHALLSLGAGAAGPRPVGCVKWPSSPARRGRQVPGPRSRREVLHHPPPPAVPPHTHTRARTHTHAQHTHTHTHTHTQRAPAADAGRGAGAGRLGHVVQWYDNSVAAWCSPRLDGNPFFLTRSLPTRSLPYLPDAPRDQDSCHPLQKKKEPHP
jgi:hypothetical protein